MNRYFVVFGLFVLSLITYIDRVCISSAKAPIAGELGFSDQQMGFIFSSFALGYALAQIPAGWFADRFGPRLALTSVVLIWSAFTSLTGLLYTLTAFLIVRFLFGVGEAGAFPGSARAIFAWLPANRRGIANGILFSGSRIGAALAFPLLAWMLGSFGWRNSFIYLGFVGIIWVILWFAFFRDNPEKSEETIEQAEEQISFGQIFKSGKMLLTMTQYFASNFTFFICLSWMLPFLEQQFKLSKEAAAGYAMIPLLFGATANWVAGFAVDFLYKKGFEDWSRRIPAMFGFGLAIIGMFLITQTNDPLSAVLCFALATFGADMTLSPSWTYCIDLGGKKSGSVSGSMNMVGNIGSFVSANAFPFLYGWTGSANTYFYIAALLNIAAVGCWFLMKPPVRNSFNDNFSLSNGSS